MKKIFIILLSTVLFFSCNNSSDNSSESGFETFKSLHEKDNGALTFSMPAFIFKMFVKSDTKDVKDAVNKIDDIDFFIQEKADDAFTDDLKKHILNKRYKSLMTFNEKSADINIVTNEKDNKINEVIIVINENTKNSCVLLKIGGDFDSNSVKKLAEGIDINEIAKYR